MNQKQNQVYDSYLKNNIKLSLMNVWLMETKINPNKYVQEPWFILTSFDQYKNCMDVSCMFLLNVSVHVCVQPLSTTNIERNDTVWSRTWISHWFLGASLTIHSNWFLALLGVRVMAVLMHHLYVYSSPSARPVYNSLLKMHIQQHEQMRDFILFLFFFSLS